MRKKCYFIYACVVVSLVLALAFYHPVKPRPLLNDPLRQFPTCPPPCNKDALGAKITFQKLVLMDI